MSRVDRNTQSTLANVEAEATREEETRKITDELQCRGDFGGN